jgi:hypothetical protein
MLLVMSIKCRVDNLTVWVHVFTCVCVCELLPLPPPVVKSRCNAGHIARTESIYERCSLPAQQQQHVYARFQCIQSIPHLTVKAAAHHCYVGWLLRSVKFLFLFSPNRAVRNKFNFQAFDASSTGAFVLQLCSGPVKIFDLVFRFFACGPCSSHVSLDNWFLPCWLSIDIPISYRAWGESK